MIFFFTKSVVRFFWLEPTHNCIFLYITSTGSTSSETLTLGIFLFSLYRFIVSLTTFLKILPEGSRVLLLRNMIWYRYQFLIRLMGQIAGPRDITALFLLIFLKKSWAALAASVFFLDLNLTRIILPQGGYCNSRRCLVSYWKNF